MQQYLPSTDWVSNSQRVQSMFPNSFPLTHSIAQLHKHGSSQPSAQKSHQRTDAHLGGTSGHNRRDSTGSTNGKNSLRSTGRPSTASRALNSRGSPLRSSHASLGSRSTHASLSTRCTCTRNTRDRSDTRGDGWLPGKRQEPTSSSRNNRHRHDLRDDLANSASLAEERAS